jgi:tricorn protease
LTDAPKYFYSQIRKKGGIIDSRFNGGGLDPDIFLRRLRRKPGSYWTRRYSHDQIVPHEPFPTDNNK